MPSIKQNNRIDRSRLVRPGKFEEQREFEAAPARGNFPPPTTAHPMGTPSQFFISSLPGIAASYDQFQRQFYGRSSLPSMRIFLPNIE